MSTEQSAVTPKTRRPGRPKSRRLQREMISVPGELAPAVREMVKAFREVVKEPRP